MSPRLPQCNRVETSSFCYQVEHQASVVVRWDGISKKKTFVKLHYDKLLCSFTHSTQVPRYQDMLCLHIQQDLATCGPDHLQLWCEWSDLKTHWGCPGVRSHMWITQDYLQTQCGDGKRSGDTLWLKEETQVRRENMALDRIETNLSFHIVPQLHHSAITSR